MRKYFLFFMILLLAISCKDKPQIEVIKSVADNYPSTQELKIINYKGLSDENALIVSRDITNVLNSMNTIEEFVSVNYLLFISEDGKIEKLVVLNSGIPGLVDKLLPVMVNWQFETIVYKSEKTNYRLEWIFALNKNDDGKFELVSSNIQMPVVMDGESYYTNVEEMPVPVGGIAAIQSKVHYPEIAKRAGIEGRVMIKALINKEGKVVYTQVLKGIGGGCDTAAIEAVKQTVFTPARSDGKPVNAQIVIPILFKLR
ncbi:MAG: energy transducer TonB [Melioribacteraceae bacterium]|nr:energy transducer TonB [Melioribacteraceae bacterium]